MTTKFIKNHAVELLLVIVIMFVSFYVAFSPPNSLANWYNNDDGFYYFKVAQNIVAGKGITFDGVNPTNGFHPLWMLICIPIFAVTGKDLLLPLRLVVIVFGLMQSASAVMIYQYIKQHIPRLLAFILVIGFMLSWVVYNNTFTGGLESGLSFLLTIIVWRLAIKYHAEAKPSLKLLMTLGLVAGLSVLSRLDNIIYIGILGIWLSFSRKNSGLLLTDMLVAILLVVFATMQRVGYSIYPLEPAILLSIGILVLFGSLVNYLMGMYGSRPFHLQFKKWYLRGLISGGITAIITWSIPFLLFQMGYLTVFPRSIIFIIGIAWFVYTSTVRAWFTRRLFANEDIQSPGGSKAWLTQTLDWAKKPFAYFLPIAGLTLIYMVWSQVNFQTPVPISGQIKHWWAVLSTTIYGSPIHSAAGLRQYLLGEESPFILLYTLVYPILLPIMRGFTASNAAWIALIGAYLILFMYDQRSEVGRWWDKIAIYPLVVATVYRVLYFYISGYVHMRSWYWTVETYLLFLLMVVVIVVWYRMYPESRFVRGLVITVSAGVVVIGVVMFAQSLIRTYPVGKVAAENRDYLTVSTMVEGLTPPGSVIGTPGGGTLSYFIHDRKIVNMDGLMNSKEYFDALRAGDTHAILKRMGVTYVFGNEIALLTSQPYATIFKDHLRPIGQVFGKTLYVYTPPR